jgi:hypothetical protein
VLVTAWAQIKRLISFLWGWLSFLGKEHMPVWLSLLLLCITAWGTYELAPKINKRIQLDNTRATYVGTTITSFNTNSVELLKATRRFNSALATSRNVQESKGVVLDRITEMQWRLMDVGVIFEDSPAGRAHVSELSSAMRHLGDAVSGARSPSDQQQVLQASGQVAATARETVAALYDEAELRERTH